MGHQHHLICNTTAHCIQQQEPGERNKMGWSILGGARCEARLIKQVKFGACRGLDPHRSLLFDHLHLWHHRVRHGAATRKKPQWTHTHTHKSQRPPHCNKGVRWPFSISLKKKIIIIISIFWSIIDTDHQNHDLPITEWQGNGHLLYLLSIIWLGGKHQFPLQLSSFFLFGSPIAAFAPSSSRN